MQGCAKIRSLGVSRCRSHNQCRCYSSRKFCWSSSRPPENAKRSAIIPSELPVSSDEAGLSRSRTNGASGAASIAVEKQADEARPPMTEKYSKPEKHGIDRYNRFVQGLKEKFSPTELSEFVEWAQHHAQREKPSHRRRGARSTRR